MPQNPTDAIAEMQEKDSASGDGELSATTTIHLDVEGVKGKRYCHDFVYTVPNLGKQVDIANLKAKWLPQGAVADPNGLSLVEQVAYLSITIDEKGTPPWWKEVWSLFDATPITTLYQEATSYEARFHGRAGSEVERKKGEDLDRGGDRLDSGGSDTEAQDLVGEEVQPPTQRRKVISSP